jgi:hypothetical protein
MKMKDNRSDEEIIAEARRWREEFQRWQEETGLTLIEMRPTDRPDVWQYRLSPYVARIQQMFELGRLKQGVTKIQVAHDDSCAIWGGGRCDCDPEISIKE